MPAKKIRAIDTKNIDSIKKLLQKLYSLESQLPGSELSVLAAFNGAYIVVTEAIGESLQNGYFENSKFVEDFTLSFAAYYFWAINAALAHDGKLPIAWSKLVAQDKTKRLPNFIYLLMGANAHINHDLSLVMLKMLDNDDTENLLQDIIKVDKLLVGSGKGILRSFSETKRLPRFIKDKLSYLYLPIVMHVILYWRIRAWKDYLNIKNRGLRSDRPQTKGKSVSNRLLRLGALLS